MMTSMYRCFAVGVVGFASTFTTLFISAAPLLIPLRSNKAPQN